jgi:hypothetical protein
MVPWGLSGDRMRDQYAGDESMPVMRFALVDTELRVKVGHVMAMSVGSCRQPNLSRIWLIAICTRCNLPFTA